MSRKLPSLNALRAFEAAARHGSFARAAAELHVTPAAVSQLVKQLENQLNTNLFRRGRQLVASESALATLPLFSDAFDQLERAVAQLRGKDGNGPLVISTPPTFAARWLVSRLDDFQGKHPGVELRLSATRRMVDFKLEDVDLAIRFGDGDYPGLHVERLMSEAIVPVAAPALATDIHGIADLARMPLLNDDWHTSQQIFPDWETWLSSQGVTPSTPLRLRHFSDSSLTLQAAVAGLGIALTWQSLVADDLARGTLVRLLDLSTASDLAYHLVMPPERAKLAKVQAFREWLLAEAAS